jgi:hypothetical protein
LVFLDRSDQYLPSDLATHVLNTHPAVNFTEVKIDSVDAISLQNLHLLNDFGGENHETYLTSTEPLVELPKYLQGTKPDPKTLQTKGAMSCVIIVVGKDEGRIIDAFYMYFYTFNQGPSVVTHEVGDHLGDWCVFPFYSNIVTKWDREHSMIRFEKGEPKAVWYSQHEYGEAYSYAAVQKAGKRPIVYSAKGSHANYATSGKHDLSEGSKCSASWINTS